MNNILSITKKELTHYFTSVTAYVVAVAFLLLAGWFFSAQLFLRDLAQMREFFNIVPLLFIIFIPAMTMRQFAEEKKQGTLELLVTMPLTDWQIIIGKFLGGVVFLGILLLLTMIHPMTLMFLAEVDLGPIIGGYLGLFFTGSALVAVGIFASSLTSSQSVSYIISLFIGFGFLLLGQIVNFAPEVLQDFLYFLSFNAHFQSIGKGIIDSRDLLYYASLIFFFLFLTQQCLENRKN